MRLMTHDTREFPLKRAVVQPSAYIGTEHSYQPVGNVRGMLSSVKDSFSVGLYGARAESMYRFVVETDTDIRKNDRVTLQDGDYTVISIARYITHNEATLEKAGVYSGDG